MSRLGDQFCARLHREHLKPIGFKKTRRTFDRQHVGWCEYYQVQGSAWNRSDSPWVFYLNCGISFDGVSRRVPDSDFPRAHAYMRCGFFVPDSRAQYDVTAENETPLLEEVAVVVQRCSNYFSARHDALRELYEANCWKMGFLADPELRGRS